MRGRQRESICSSAWGTNLHQSRSAPDQSTTTSVDDLPGKCSLAYCSQAFAGLPTFCPITFHLLFSYSLIAENSAAF